MYEQYLGYVGQVQKQRAKEAQAKLDLGIQTAVISLTEKMERRKEQGIYYTPKFVTNYIVTETVGYFLKEHSYNQALNIKILDPACGSGSFLIRAYDELLGYHASQYNKQATELDQWERLPILTRNIFGVDLDLQAVEIARLNLLLRSLAKRDLLPSLADNIRQGNSIISGMPEELKSAFGEKWKTVKPFNWDQEFQDIMSQGGFDVVIGNPPYGIIFDPAAKAYLEKSYATFKRNNELYVAFINRGLQLLKNGGLFSMILPNTFLRGTYFDSIKRYILSNASILKILDFGINQVFPEPNVFNCILILRKEADTERRNKNVVKFSSAITLELSKPDSLRIENKQQSELMELWWKSVDEIVGKVLKIEPKLGNIEVDPIV